MLNRFRGSKKTDINMRAQPATFLRVILLACMVCPAMADQFDILSPRFSGTSQTLHGVAFGNGAYVAVGDNGTIRYSTDSITWIPRVSGTTNRLCGVKYGAGGFVAVPQSQIDYPLFATGLAAMWQPAARA